MAKKFLPLHEANTPDHNGLLRNDYGKKPRPRRRGWRRDFILPTLTLTVGLMLFTAFSNQLYPLVHPNGVLAFVGKGANFAPTTSSPADLPKLLENNNKADSSLFAVREKFSEATPKRASDTIPQATTLQNVSTTAIVVTPAAIGEEQAQVRRIYLESEQALREGNLEQAKNLLLPLTQGQPNALTTGITEQLYTVYLALGDQSMRRGERSLATDYYQEANRLTIANKSGLQRRLESMARLFPVALAETPSPTTVPQAPATATPFPQLESPQSAPTARPFLARASCPDNHITLLSPRMNSVISGFVPVTGSVGHERLWYYKLEWASAGSEEFSYFGGGSQSVENNQLAMLNTQELPNGNYVIRVTVVDNTGNYPPPCTVTVTIRN